MKLQGRVTSVTPTQTGEGAKGEWKKNGFMLVYKDGEYEKQLYFTGFGKIVEPIEKLKIDQMVEVLFSAESRIYNDKPYTDCKPYRIDILDTVAPGGTAQTNIDPLPF